ncbi:MAG TPA: 5-oxoprolinase subunit PxpB [Vicinamibacterales bacterium]|nr:5-oxoprolinase subunit PxpB [Vicinamibacterales bacterium]
MNPTRLRDAGDSALLLECDAVIDLEINERAIGVAAAMRRAAIEGVRDVVSTYRSVAVYFDPLTVGAETVRAALERAAQAPPARVEGKTVVIPVEYGGEAGPDLADVAAFAGVSQQQAAAMHASVPYRVFMLGFLPGFAYMGSVDEAIAMPRRSTPRLRVPAGSVGIAGRQTGIYPRESPGGWRIIGRTAMPVFDGSRSPAALLAPGDVVSFVPEKADKVPYVVSGASRTEATGETGASRHVTVLRPGLFSTIQDAGRWGHQASGVPVSGALDRVSHRVANALVGNDATAATLEVTLVGPEIRMEADALVAFAGADIDLRVDGASIPINRAVSCRSGSVLRFGERRSGARAYLAFDGGVAADPVLGSRATSVLCALGPLGGRALAAGDRLPLGPATTGGPSRVIDLPHVRSAGGARLRVLPGPQDDGFPAEAFARLQGTRFTVTPQSDRMGYRLSGGRIPRIEGREMISDATFTGAVQVPPSGEPILLMADRQTTGGYPQIATVITADLPMAGQLAPGDWIEFQVCSRPEALSALVAQEGKLLALR